MVSLEEIQNAEITDLPVRKRIEAFYKGTHAVTKFAEAVMLPVLKGQFNLNDKEKAIVGTYYRMYLWINSMVVMNSRIHFQGAASAARSLFELLLDIKILAADKTGEMVDKFHAFPTIEKFRVADNLISFCDRYKGKTNLDDSRQRSFINKPGKKQNIEQIIIKNWGENKKGKPNRPDHWTGKKIPERAHAVGFEYEELYVDVYHLLSWHIHAGSTGYAGWDEYAIESSFGHSHGIAQRVFLDATITCAKEMKISSAVEKFYRIIEDLRLIPGRVLIKEQIELLEKAETN